MSWGIVAGATIGAIGTAYSADRARSGSRDAANISADAEMQGLEYLKEAERLPMFYRDQALGLLAGEYGLAPYSETPIGYTYEQTRNPEYDELQSQIAGLHPRATVKRNQLKERLASTPEFLTDKQPVTGEPMAGGMPSRSVADIAMGSPLYSAILSGREAGEESIARNRAAVGGLRGGATINDLTRYNTELENQALLTSYQNVMGGLSSLAGAQGYAPQIAGQYSNIGRTLGAGRMAGVQAEQDAIGGIASSVGTGVKAYFDSKV